LTPAALAVIPVLRRGDWHRSLDVAPSALTRAPALGLAPEIQVRGDAKRLRAGRLPTVTGGDRVRMLREAGLLFTSGTVHCAGLGAQTPEDFRALLWSAAGYPPALVDRWCAMLAGLWEQALAAGLGEAEPAGSPSIGLVALPGNTFTCLESAVQMARATSALWIRPSAREPYSSLRWLCALLDVGWPPELLGYYPSAHRVLLTLIDVTDRQIVYGGPELRDSLIDRPATELHGPLRALCVVADSTDAEVIVADLVELIAGDAGRFCTAVRTVLCLGDSAEIGARLAAALDGMALRPGRHRLPLTASPDATAARRIADFIDARLTAGARRLTRRPTLASCDGLAILAPTLLELPGPDPADCEPSWSAQHPLFGFEAPFPVASVVPVTAAQAAALARQADVIHRLPP
jgi:hypothetical protein